MRLPHGSFGVLIIACQGPTSVTGPALFIENGGVRLPEIVEGQAARGYLYLRNVGNAPLSLYSAEVVATPAWRPVAWPRWPLTLAPDVRLALRLVYAPSEGVADGNVWIESDDYERPRRLVPLAAFDPLPSITCSVERVEFDEVPSGGVGHAHVRLANRGSATLDVRRVVLTEETSPDFSLEMEQAEQLAPGEWLEANVLYRPTDGDVDQGVLLVETNDPNQPQFLVPLRGTQTLPQIY